MTTQQRAGAANGAGVVARLGIAVTGSPPASAARFPDGAHMRIEIPSVEGPEALRAVFEAADAHGVVVNRVSQGSGAMLVTRAELKEMAVVAADRGAEVSLFIGPREEWDVGASARSPEGQIFAGRIRGSHQLRYAVDDVLRAVEQGIRGFLVADTGLLEVLVDMQRRSELPADIVWKISAVLAPSNPATFAQLERLGASTVNVPSDMTLAQLAEMRSVSELPIDLYLESPDASGGVVRGHELAEILTVAAPLYAKFGLRNARAVYPAGAQLRGDVLANVREKVRRAALGLEWAQRSGVEYLQSPPGAKGLGIPVP